MRKRTFRKLVPVGAMLSALVVSGTAHAVVEGDLPTVLESYRVFGDGKAIGNTLMANPPPTTNVNTVLLPSSFASLNGIPADADPEGVFLWWSGSLPPEQGVPVPDETATLTLPGGQTMTVMADECKLVTAFPTSAPLSFYYCRADVTSFVASNPGMNGYNGMYTVGSVEGDTGNVSPTGACAMFDPHCQEKYAAWSMVFVYDSPTVPLQRDVLLYDGFVVADEEANPASLGQFSFTMSGFEVGSVPEAEITYFGLEGDANLGAGPQRPLPGLSRFRARQRHGPVRRHQRRRQRVQLEHRAGASISTSFASARRGGGSGILATGDTMAQITVGSGDQALNASEPTGETLFFGWTFLRLNRPSSQTFGARARPRSPTATRRRSARPSTTPVSVVNQGSLAATQVSFVDTLPAGLTYEPNSLRVDGMPCTDAADGDRCRFTGGTVSVNLGTVPAVGDNDRLITFRTTMTEMTVGTEVCNTAEVDSMQTSSPSSIGPECVTVRALDLGQPLKALEDLSGGLLGPNDSLGYSVTIPGDPRAPVRNLVFEDDLPEGIELVSVSGPGGGAVNQSSLTGGANGSGRVRFTNVSIPAGGFVTHRVRGASGQRWPSSGPAGIADADIDGQNICNQGGRHGGDTSVGPRHR